MPNINITDSRKRDAVVRAENTGVSEEIRYVDSDGSVASTRKVLKATVAHDFDTLSKQFGDDPQKLGYALIEGDPEVDMERCGVYLWGVSKVYVSSDDGIVYRIEQTEKVLDAEGEVRETRPRRRAEANVDADIPLTWTGRKIKKTDAIRRFVFTSKLQVVHVNGLTYDFLYGMAKELDNERSLMMVGGGSDGKDPLVFRRGSLPYRGFLEGRVDGDQYILLLHLSNMELKVPESAKSAVATSHESESGVKEEKDQSDEEQRSEKKATTTTDKGKDDSLKEAQRKEAKPKNSDLKKSPANTSQDKKSDAKPEGQDVAPKASKKKKAAAAKPTTSEEVVADDEPERVAANANELNQVAESQKSAYQNEVNSEDLGIWLKSIRMGKYLELFVENEIDVDVLAELSDDDLKELEIPLGSRRRLLKAVEEADNLRAEVAMAVSKISRSSADTNTTSKSAKKKKVKKKKPTTKKAGKQSD